MKRKQSRTIANIERLQRMLTDLADTSGTVRGWPYWKLANEFNKRYATQTRPINAHTLASYIKQAKETGWLSTLQERENTTMLTFVLKAHEHNDSSTLPYNEDEKGNIDDPRRDLCPQ